MLILQIIVWTLDLSCTDQEIQTEYFLREKNICFSDLGTSYFGLKCRVSLEFYALLCLLLFKLCCCSIKTEVERD